MNPERASKEMKGDSKLARPRFDKDAYACPKKTKARRRERRAVTVLLCAFLFVLGHLVSANAALYNVAQGASVSLSGNFFTEYRDWSVSHPDGSPGSRELIASIVDGKSLNERTQWDQGTLWWDEHGQGTATVFIDLGKEFFIDSFRVQADNNDTYRISYYDEGMLEWTDIGHFGSWGMITRPMLAPPDTIRTSQLAVQAIGGDGWYSISEIQAYGQPVPIPAAVWLFGSGLIGLVGITRKSSQHAR